MRQFLQLMSYKSSCETHVMGNCAPRNNNDDEHDFKTLDKDIIAFSACHHFYGALAGKIQEG